jgi:hypothetical protein
MCYCILVAHGEGGYGVPPVFDPVFILLLWHIEAFWVPLHGGGSESIRNDNALFTSFRLKIRCLRNDDALLLDFPYFYPSIKPNNAPSFRNIAVSDRKTANKASLFRLDFGQQILLSWVVVFDLSYFINSIILRKTPSGVLQDLDVLLHTCGAWGGWVWGSNRSWSHVLFESV